MNYIKVIILVFALIIFFLLEYFFPFFKGIKLKKKIIHDAYNLIFAVFNFLLIFLLFKYPLNYIFKLSKEHSIGLLNLLPFYFFIEFIIGFILFDLWMYFWHFLNHKVKYLWIFHRMHHSDNDLDSTSALRFHTGEIIISTILRIPVILIIGLNLEILIIYEIVLNISTIFHHSNFNLPEKIDNLLMHIIVTPNMHRVHHSQNQFETDSNYSTTTSLWDRIFRTFKRRIYPIQINLGLKEFEAKKWQDIRGMFITPFVKIKK